MDVRYVLPKKIFNTCKLFYRYVYGCVQSCDDVDACNAASTLATPPLLEMLYQRFISHLFLLFIFLYLSRETKIIQYCTP